MRSLILRSFRILAACLALAIISAHLQANPRVLFVSDKAGNNFDLYTVSSDGSNLERLTETPGSEWAPALAPDGNRIAYVDPGQDNKNLFITDLAGSEAIDVGIAHKALAVQWVNDETLLYFRDIEPGSIQTFQIWQVGIDGSDEKALYETTFRVWTTGSDRFQYHQANARLYFSSFLTDAPVTLRSGELDAEDPNMEFLRCDDPDFPPRGPQLVDHYDFTVAPDGSLMAFAADHGRGSHRIYVRALNGDCSQQRRLSDVFCGDPAWAPTGNWIAFTRAPQSSFGARSYIGDLIRIDADGSNEINLTAGIGAVSGRCAHAVIYDTAAECAEFKILEVSLDSNVGLSITWEAVPGISYQVEYTENFVNWKDDLPDSLLQAGEEDQTLTFSDDSLAAIRFYRIHALCP